MILFLARFAVLGSVFDETPFGIRL